jgi:predicted methyltransferase
LTKLTVVLLAGAAVFGIATPGLAAPMVSPAITAALADTTRPEADVKRDADRKAADTLAFTGIKPGDKVMDLVPGGGYFTKLFVDIVGPRGHVYSVYPAELAKIPRAATVIETAKTYAAAHPNDTVLIEPANTPTAPEKLDIVFTAQNYHDLHDPFMGPADLTSVNKTVYDALKPGGVYIVIDHSAPAGSGLADTNTLHRIDEAVVKSEVEAAGFVLESEGTFLANPADTRETRVFDPSIRGHTDQFVLKFKKPA